MSRDEEEKKESNGIEVFLRIRPSTNPSGYINQDDIDETQIVFQLPKKHQQLDHSINSGEGDDIVNNTRTKYGFKFNGILDEEATQDDVYRSIGAPAVQNVLEGFNSTVFAYGQTGSGKTYTITGGPERYSDRGIIPRAISMLFDSLQNDQNISFLCYVSYFELYNESGYDLLAKMNKGSEESSSKVSTNRMEISKQNDLPKITMLEDEDGNYHFKNLSVNQVSDEEEALNMLFIGDTNRAIGETKMNQSSSRSHCIFTIMVEMRRLGSDTVIRSKLNLVDLAGSERVHKTHSSGQTLKEAQYINSSLFFLEMVIVALHERTKKGKENMHIPYRNSMMTSVLRDSLGGNCKTIMIATISPEAQQTDESISTCHFAQRVALVKNNAYINEELDPALVIKRLKIEIKRLKEEVKFLKGENGEGDDLSEDQHRDLEKQARDFLFDQSGCKEFDVGVLTLTKIKASYLHFKRIFQEHTENTKQPNNEHPPDENDQSHNNEIIQNLRRTIRQRDDEIKILVGMVKKGKEKNGFSPVKNSNSNTSFDNIQMSKTELSTKTTEKVCGVEECTDTQILDDPSLAFDWFRERHHAESIISENKLQLQRLFQKAKSAGETVKSARETIQHHKSLIENSRRNIAFDNLGKSNLIEDDCSREEIESRNEIEEKKKIYENGLKCLRDLKNEIEHTKRLAEKSRISLQQDFDTWYDHMCSNRTNHTLILSKDATQVTNLAALTTPTRVSLSSQCHDESSMRDDKFVLPPGARLTGIKETDDDIIAFYKAKEALLARKKSRNNN